MARAGTRGVTKIELCGGPFVEFRGRRVERELAGPRSRLLLAYLALNRHRWSTRPELISAVWPDRMADHPDGALSTQLSRLRRALGPGAIEGRRELRLVLPDDAWVDVEAAARCIDATRAAMAQGDWRGAADVAAEALPILARDLLPGEEAPWLDHWRDELCATHVELLEAVARAGLVLRDARLNEAERAARRMIELAPYRESGYRTLMEVHAARGNSAEALQVYDLVRVILRDELGTVPGADLQALHKRLIGS